MTDMSAIPSCIHPYGSLQIEQALAKPKMELFQISHDNAPPHNPLKVTRLVTLRIDDLVVLRPIDYARISFTTRP